MEQQHDKGRDIGHQPNLSTIKLRARQQHSIQPNQNKKLYRQNTKSR